MIFKTSRSLYYSSIPLLAIFACETAKVFFLLQLKTEEKETYFLITLWIGLQVAFSIINGMISDRSSRKNVLALMIVGKLAAIWMFCNESYLLGICIDGIFGNINPIARAAYCDIHISEKRTPNIVNTFLVQPLPWILFSLVSSQQFLKYSALFTASFSLIIVMLLFSDFRDKNSFSETSVLKKLIRKGPLLLALAFLLLNIQWEVLLYKEEELLTRYDVQNVFFLIVGVAFFIGVLIARVFNLKPEKIIFYVFLFISIIFFLDWQLYSLLRQITLPDTYMQFTLLGGIGQPLIYAFFGNRVKLHEQGTAYGFLESIQSFSEFLAPITLILIQQTTNFYVIILPVSIISTSLVALALLTKKKRTV